MKNISIITAFIICFFNIAKAQTDYCKDITKVVTADNVLYDSPTNYLSISKSIEADGIQSTILCFAITKKVENHLATGEQIFFADGTAWRNPQGHLVCGYMKANLYSYTAFVTITDEVINLFKTKKIIKVQISDKVIPVTDAYATQFMAYMNCIDAKKE